MGEKLEAFNCYFIHCSKIGKVRSTLGHPVFSFLVLGHLECFKKPKAFWNTSLCLSGTIQDIILIIRKKKHILKKWPPLSGPKFADFTTVYDVNFEGP